MQISKKAWQSYVNRLAAINKTAARKVDAYAAHVGLERAEEIVRYAYSVATQYGAMSASLACEMYDQLAAAQNVAVSPAVPAETATFEEAARATYGAIRDTPNRIGDPAGRFVKRSAADTMLQNAMRDGAEWAWIPQSTACAFCLTLASQGWQHASKAVMSGRHAKHIHNNCRCEFAVRFDGISDVEGYDPDALYDLYINAEGDTSRDRINFLRRELYADNMDVINAQNRTAYATGKARGIVATGEERDIIINREMAGAFRRSYLMPLTETEKEFVRKEIVAIEADENKFVFRDFAPTCYSDEYDIVYISSSVFPAADGKSPVGTMSVRAVLAHEYYGHRVHRNTKARPGSWNDEFRAHYFAATKHRDYLMKIKQCL